MAKLITCEILSNFAYVNDERKDLPKTLYSAPHYESRS